jgi:hypothetical protein
VANSCSCEQIDQRIQLIPQWRNVFWLVIEPDSPDQCWSETSYRRRGRLFVLTNRAFRNISQVVPSSLKFHESCCVSGVVVRSRSGNVLGRGNFKGIEEGIEEFLYVAAMPSERIHRTAENSETFPYMLNILQQMTRGDLWETKKGRPVLVARRLAGSASNFSNMKTAGKMPALLGKMKGAP